MKKTVFIEGMSCKHCSGIVSESLNEIEGIKAKVNLKKNIAVISSNSDFDLDVIKNAIEKNGYKVIKII